MSYLARVRAALDDLERRSLRREVRASAPYSRDFSSNDYLGMSQHPDVLTAFRTATRVGSGGSRLLAGAYPEHAALERDLATWLGRERAILFSSGYLAALGAIVSLAGLADAVYSDAENHACIIDAIRLTKRERHVVAHGSIPRAPDRKANALIVTESLFGMSAALADMGALVAGLGDGDVLVVDEAHALGVLGAGGSGRCAPYGDPRVVVIGTLSKALGGVGGFVAGPAAVIELLATSARTFMFDTAAPPALVRAMCVAVDRVRGADGDRRRTRLRENTGRLRAGLAAAAGDSLESWDVPIVPIVIGDTDEALAFARDLEVAGIYAPAIRPPTVPPGSARLRITVRADHTADDIDALLAALASRRPVGA